jgi:SAM-dependent methyltransferase
MAALTQTKPRAVVVHADQLVEPPPPAGCAAPEWCAYFENLYRDADGEMSRVPWADGCANPSLQSWLNAEAPGLLRPGATVAVVGCGLGDDAKELTDRGYEVVGFDVSQSAIQWARSRHPEMADRFIVADLFQLPPGLQRRADLVVEVNTLQSLHPNLRSAAAAGIASLARPRGMIVAICRGCDNPDSACQAPPFPLAPHELESHFSAHGFSLLRAMDDFLDDESPPVRRLRAVFKRGG